MLAMKAIIFPLPSAALALSDRGRWSPSIPFLILTLSDGVDARNEEDVIALVDGIEKDVGPMEVCVFNIGGNVKFSVLDTSVRVYTKVRLHMILRVYTRVIVLSIVRVYTKMMIHTIVRVYTQVIVRLRDVLGL